MYDCILNIDRGGGYLHAMVSAVGGTSDNKRIHLSLFSNKIKSLIEVVLKIIHFTT